jgi:hypothetical protein
MPPVPKINLEGKTIVLVSSESWGSVFVSKHYYALELSKKNRVIFVNSVNLPSSFKNLFTVPAVLKKTEIPGIETIDYGNPLPRLNRWPYMVQRWAFKRVIKRIKQLINTSDEKLIIWNFDLSRFIYLPDWGARRTIGHVVELLNHDFFKDKYKYRVKMLDSADVILTIADLIKEEIREALPHREVYFINHGAAISQYQESIRNRICKLPGKNSIKAAYVGNFQVSFNFELLESLAINYPFVDFVLIGPVGSSNLGTQKPGIGQAIGALEKMPNIFFLGQVPAKELMSYLIVVDINLVLYDEKFARGHCNPHKLMSYFYAGKVIVSSFIDQYKNRPNLVMMVRKNEEFESLFGNVVANLNFYNSAAQQKVRVEYAEEHDYTRLITHVEDILNY